MKPPRPPAPEPAKQRPESKPEPGLLFRLALADLWHERLLSFCLAAALTAVLAPLLVLLGLRFGLVSTLRDRLITDPRNREIRPLTSASFDENWFRQIKTRPDVAFVVPATRQISSTVRIQAIAGPGEPPASADARVEADIMPTGPGDVLITENRGFTPAEGECAATAELAKALGLRPGSFVQITASRSAGGKLELVRRDLRVCSVLAERASSLKTIFVPLPFLEAVENYKDGLAVPAYGWPGGTAAAEPVYDAAYFAIPGGLPETELNALRATSGFVSIRETQPSSLPPLDPHPAGENLVFYRAATGEGNGASTIESSALAGLHRVLQPKGAAGIYAWTKPVTFTVSDAHGKSLGTVSAASLAALAVGAPGVGEEVTQRATAPASAARTPNSAVKQAPVVPQTLPPLAAQQRTDKPESSGAPRLTEVIEPEHARPNVRSQRTPVRGDQTEKEKGSRGPIPSEDEAAERPPPVPKTKKKKQGGSIQSHWETTGGAWVPVLYQAPPQPDEDPAPVFGRAVFQPAAGSALLAGTHVTLSYSGPHGTLSLPAICGTQTRSATALIPAPTAGLFRLADERSLAWDPAAGQVVLARTGYAGFRLYARTIDEVEGVVAALAAQGLSVFTKAERIRDVKELDRSTHFVFWLIAAVGLTGCAGALLASLYAAVERKRRTLATLRLLGLSSTALARMPFYQATCLASLSVLASVCIYWSVAGVINRFATRYLEAGEQLNHLPSAHLAAAWIGAILLAAAAAFLAAMRVLSIQPSEALRDE